ncbi:hypothetical protein EYF80_046539 [Liparis tanakae]|uniref:Uncharacterized protein n=1 Tax=Liparis tanakae TaxID=230148 RepID=A0A4Z2FQ28_9TELE|nr:hypothetical protein EYF80_046539 [Liparis tanakae]
MSVGAQRAASTRQQSGSHLRDPHSSETLTAQRPSETLTAQRPSETLTAQRPSQLRDPQRPSQLRDPHSSETLRDPHSSETLTAQRPSETLTAQSRQNTGPALGISEGVQPVETADAKQPVRDKRRRRYAAASLRVVTEGRAAFLPDKTRAHAPPSLTASLYIAL